MMDKTNITAERIAELTRESVDVVPYDPEWPKRFAEAEDLLNRSLPSGIIQLISHIGSTAVPGISGKPIIDIQVEVTSLERVVREVVPIMERLGYEFIWRPTMGERAPFYAWFIKRDANGKRTHHIHLVEPDGASADRIRFRELLRSSPEVRKRYVELKHDLASRYPNDRAAYTMGKTEFIKNVLAGNSEGLSSE